MINFVIKRKTLMLSLIAVLFVVVVGISFAYFGSFISDPAKTNVDVVSSIVPRLIFHPGADLSFDPGVVTDTTNPTVQLIGVDDGVSVTEYYNIYLNVTLNTFKYTTGDEKPEVLLQVKDPNGAYLMNIPGLEYVTEAGISGFDVTMLNAMIPITINNEIITDDYTTGTIEPWEITLVYIDLLEEQFSNNNQNFEADIIFQGNEEFEVFKTSILEKNRDVTYIESKGVPNFTNAAVTKNYYDSLSSSSKLNYSYNYGLYKTTDNYGDSYYFRGSANNNWVSFADHYWRIVRINGDGSIRLIYAGDTKPTSNESLYNTGVNIGTSVFNSLNTLAEYTGYMYTEGESNGVSTSSVIKTTLDTWYEQNLVSYDNLITDTLFCSDRSIYTGIVLNNIYTGTGIGDIMTNYGGAGRLVNIVTWSSMGEPCLNCSNEDAFTVNDEVTGNGALSNKIGLLTADEAVMAGIIPGVNNSNNYLYTNEDFYTMTPFTGGSSGEMFIVNASGQLSKNSLNIEEAIRPVININGDIRVTGTGFYNDPYIVN